MKKNMSGCLDLNLKRHLIYPNILISDVTYETTSKTSAAKAEKGTGGVWSSMNGPVSVGLGHLSHRSIKL